MHRAWKRGGHQRGQPRGVILRDMCNHTRARFSALSGGIANRLPRPGTESFIPSRAVCDAPPAALSWLLCRISPCIAVNIVQPLHNTGIRPGVGRPRRDRARFLLSVRSVRAFGQNVVSHSIYLARKLPRSLDLSVVIH